MPSSVCVMTTEQGLESRENSRMLAIREFQGRTSTLFERIDASLLRTAPNRSTPPEKLPDAHIRRFVVVGLRLAMGRDPTTLKDQSPTPGVVR